MRISRVMCCAATAVAYVFVCLCEPSVARASGGGIDLNGTYIAQSNGQWAKTNEQYRDEAVVRSTWTITTSCTTATDCTGRVTSDQGWSSDVYTTNGTWYVKRDLENWEPCYDGSSAPGHQIIWFYPVGADGGTDSHSTIYAGEDKTVSPSGSCGRNQSLVIRMPFRLQKVA